MAFQDVKFFHELTGDYLNIDALGDYHNVSYHLRDKNVITIESNWIHVLKDFALVSEKSKMLMRLTTNQTITVEDISKFLLKVQLISNYLSKYPELTK